MGWISKLITLARAKPPAGEQGVANAMARLGSPMAYWPAVTDDLIDKRGAADIYVEMQYDPQVAAALTIVTSGVLARGWDVVGDDARLVDFVRQAFDDMTGSLDQILEEVLRDRAVFGTAIVERVWELEDDRIRYAALKPRDPRLYSWDLDEYNNITAMYLSVQSERRPVDPNKFAIFANRPSHGQPWGTSELRGAYRWYWLKKQIVQYWGAYLEKFGMPTVKGTVPRGASTTQQQELLRVLEKIQQETAIVIPDDIAVELMASNTQQHGGGFDVLVAYCDQQIVKTILGQTLTTSEGERVGSMALGQVHKDVLDVLIARQRRSTEEWVDEQIIRPLVEYNFGPVEQFPNFVLQLDETNTRELSETIFRLVSCGVVDPSESWIREYLGLPDREEITEVAAEGSSEQTAGVGDGGGGDETSTEETAAGPGAAGPGPGEPESRA